MDKVGCSGELSHTGSWAEKPAWRAGICSEQASSLQLGGTPSRGLSYLEGVPGGAQEAGRPAGHLPTTVL